MPESPQQPFSFDRKTNLLSVSGGKDSTALILHALDRDIQNLRYVFADTGNEHDDVYEYLDYLEYSLGISIERVKPDFSKRIRKKREYVEKHWEADGVPQERIDAALEMLVPTGNPFLDLCIWKGRFPSTKVRFCTDELKTFPITEQVVFPILKAGGKVRSWQGIRADESRARAEYKMHQQIDFGIWVYRPLLHWNAADVFDAHRKHGIKPNPLYLKGMNRVGCMPCVMCRKDELSEIGRRFPDVIERIRRWEKIVSKASKQGSSTFFTAVSIGNPQDGERIHHETHGIDSAVRWSMTTHGGVQYDLFKTGAEIPVCQSNYGLCELPDSQVA